MSNFWQQMTITKQAEIEHNSRRLPLSLLHTLCEEAPPVNSAYVSLCLGQHRPKLLADLGRRFSTHDMVAQDFDPASWGHHMQSRGASVFTIPTHNALYKTSLDDLKAMRQEFDLPIIRRDFIMDEYQIYETRAAGADSFTLYCRLHDRVSLQYHIELGRELGMEPLLICSEAKELELAADTDALMVGIALSEQNLNNLLPAFKAFAKKDKKVATIIDAIHLSQTRLQQFNLSDMTGVIYSHKSLRYEYQAQFSPTLPSSARHKE